ncbi:PEGA domain-containing protein [Treponema sp. R80B11-R83G3]
MKEARCLLVFIFLVLTMPLFAKGKTDETAIKTQNDEWFLCITNFDAKALPSDKLNISDVVLKELTNRLKTINYHTRISPEYAYYEEYAWARARASSAKTLSAKIDERSKQVYMGEPDWKYRQNIVKLDAEIKKLRENLEEIDNNAPLINKEPVFKLTSGTLNLTFPAAPEKGSENRFCATQKADAFLTGNISDFHGRYFLKIKLYTVYTKSYVWEDSAVFSYGDINAAIDEITRKLLIVLSGNHPAAVAVKAEPETALVLINRSFAGKGDVSLTEYPPGKITVTASAPDHESIVLDTELVSGELTEINLKLNPIEYVNTEITGNGRVYHGALYIGESPLTLRLPANNLEYVEMENVNGKKGSIVFKTLDSAEYEQSVSVKTSLPIKKGRVDKERRGYYWAWGSQWITGIAAWIFYYSFLSASDAYNQSGALDLQENMINMYYLSTGSAIAFGVASAYGIYRMIRYIYYSGKDSASIAPQGGKK